MSRRRRYLSLDDARLDRAHLFYGCVAILRGFRGEYGRKACAALLLHSGGKLEWLPPNALAVWRWRTR